MNDQIGAFITHMTKTSFCVTIVASHLLRSKMKTAKDYIVSRVTKAWDRCGYDCMAIFLFFMIGVEII